ncbi:GSP1 protein [Gonium pectorale]|uniref:GSP1 protein n=1 Tax=Gonium pectorale TaxID=33097 RepID=A0A150FVY9_GONPE|nr:GSP1 protein [Gonium pectorale]|eukprot:KXZ41783.1 GSP1 protein [Gonium pectorale]
MPPLPPLLVPGACAGDAVTRLGLGGLDDVYGHVPGSNGGGASGHSSVAGAAAVALGQAGLGPQPGPGSYLAATVQLLHDCKLYSPDLAPAPTVTHAALGAATAGSGAGVGGGLAAAPAPVLVWTETERRAAQSAAVSRFMVQSDRLITELLTHLGFSEAQAEAAIQGSLSAFPGAAANVVNLVLRLRSSLLSAYIRHLDTGAAAASRGSSGGGDSDAVLSEPAAALAQLQVHSGVADSLLQMLRARFRSSACQLWALANIVDPRPPRPIKLSLAAYTGKTSKQVTDWFTNWRARHWRPTIMALDVEGSAGAGGKDVGATGAGRGGGGGDRAVRRRDLAEEADEYGDAEGDFGGGESGGRGFA